ncbi:MAG TPA: hypothetical protein VM241_09165 [Candidatus Thermoplasmatota archaeon]|nr:hypothetical protein [Candidatus Thermoplasmatota archaeon]
MTAPDPTLFAAAAFAPVAVWVLWRGQTLSVEALRRSLLWMARGGLRWLYATVSWFGTLVHEMSHASVLLLSGHGISQFRVGSERGHVTPTHVKTRGVGMLSFLVAALAPLFIPPLLVLVALLLLVDKSLLVLPAPGPGLAPALDALKAVLLEFPLRLVQALARLDLARWQHAALLGLVLLALPGSRPSHVRGSRFHGPGEGDVPVLRAHIRGHPVPFILFLLLLYGAYFLTLVLPAAYWWPIGAVWALALTGIVLALVGAAWWGLVGLAGRTHWLLGWLGPAAFVAVQAGARLLQPAPAVATINLLSLAAWLAVGLLLFVVARRR